MIDLTQQNDEDLADWYLDDEYMYNFVSNCGSLERLRADAERRFIFTQAQWDVIEHYYTDPNGEVFMK